MPRTLPLKSMFAAAAVVLATVLALVPRPAHAQAPDLFFSEYTEGTSFNKAIEIYNATGAAVDLGAGQYVLQLFSNGAGAPTASVALAGVVANGDVFVAVHPSAGAALLGVADLQDSTVVNWNGDDAIALRKGGAAGPLVDVLGQIGVDPGTEWGAGLVSTADNSAVIAPSRGARSTAVIASRRASSSARSRRRRSRAGSSAGSSGIAAGIIAHKRTRFRRPC